MSLQIESPRRVLLPTEFPSGGDCITKEPDTKIRPLAKNVTSQPAVRHHTDEVLGWERFKHRDKELDCVLVLTKILLEEEKLMVENYLTVHVLYQGETRVSSILRVDRVIGWM